MALTDAQLKALIVLEVGDNDAGIVAANIDTIWTLYETHASAGTNIRYLYAKLKALDVLMGAYRKYVDSATDGNSYKLSQLVANLKAMREATLAELEDQSAQLAQQRGPAVGELTRTAPVEASDRDIPPTRMDANDPSYRGDMYWRRGGVVG